MRASPLFLLLTAVVLGACGDDGADPVPVAPDPPTLTLGTYRAMTDTDPGMMGEDAVRAATGSADVIPCDGSMVLTLRTTNWLLKPPGSCSSTPECGHVAVRATGPNGDVIALRAVTLTPYFPLVPPAAWAGSVRFDAELVDDAGDLYETPEPDAAPVRASRVVELSTRDDCSGPAGEGGAPAADPP